MTGGIRVHGPIELQAQLLQVLLFFSLSIQLCGNFSQRLVDILQLLDDLYALRHGPVQP